MSGSSRSGPYERVCPLHGPYEAARPSTPCPAEFWVRHYVDLRGTDIGCPGRTWRADDQPSRLTMLWRRLDAWVKTDKSAYTS